VSPSYAARTIRRMTFAFRVFGNVADEQNFLGSERFARLGGERVF
jgi:hypothetical protein